VSDHDRAVAGGALGKARFEAALDFNEGYEKRKNFISIDPNQYRPYKALITARSEQIGENDHGMVCPEGPDVKSILSCECV
jgi:hypothetical protein